MKFSSGSGFNSPGYPPSPPGGGYAPPTAFAPMGPMGPQASGGVKAIGIISIVLGALCSICVCVGVMMSLGPQPQPQPQPTPGLQAFQDDSQVIVKKIQPIGIPASIVNEIMSLFLIITGIGTLKLARWGRTMGMIYAGLEIGRALILAIVYAMMLLPIRSQLTSGGGTALLFGVIFLGPVFSSIYPLVLLYFYTRPNVKAQFAGGPPNDQNPYGPPPGGPSGPGGYPGQPMPSGPLQGQGTYPPPPPPPPPLGPQPPYPPPPDA
jgi:hypothetical protein